MLFIQPNPFVPHASLTLVFFLFSISNSLFAQFEPDTLQRQIDEIVVVGYETNRNILETPVSVALVNPQTITGLDASSLLFGLNTIAGVRMEERAPGSYRIRYGAAPFALHLEFEM